MSYFTEQYVDITNKIRGILDRAQAEKRDLTDDESQTMDRMFADAEKFLQRAEQEKRAAQMAAAVEGLRETRAVAPSVLGQQPDRNAEQRQAFEAYVRRGLHQMPQEQRALLSGTGGGSYLVPTEIFNRIIQALGALVPMRQICSVFTTASKADIPVATGKPTAAWTAENAATTPSDPTIAQKQLRAKKLATISQVSEELLSDSLFDVETWIVQQISMAFAEAEDAAFVNGNGTSEPAGVVAAVTAGPTAATVSTISADNVVDLYFSLPAQYASRGVFMMRNATMAAIAKLKDSSNRYLWMPPFGTNAFNTIFGRPIYLDENVPAMGANARSVVFFDPTFYVIGDRLDMEIQRLEELYIANGLKAFRATKRTDGLLTLADAGRALVHPAV